MAFADAVENLKNFDVNEMDVKNAGSWPFLIKVIVIAFLIALLLGGVYWFVIKDMYADWDSVTRKEAELKRVYKDKAHQVANLQLYKDQMAEMEKTFGELLKQLPGDTEVPGLLEDITNTGLGSGLEIRKIELSKEKSQEFYVELPINIEAKGTYHDLASFISGVASLPRIVTLHDFNIERDEKDKSEILDMKIGAKTYRYKTGENEG